MIRVLISGFFVLAGSTFSRAHGGHLGDLAGHSHWLGWGMVAAAGVIVAVLGTKTKGKQDDDEAAAEGETDSEVSPS
ncbi:MAG: hypothetical protein QM488_08675 [Rhizobiaceae bacterium]